MFKEFKALVENQTKKRIKVSRIENGGEFYGNEFEELCKKCSIEDRRLLHIHLNRMELHKG